MKRLAELYKKTIDINTLKRLRAKVADAKITKAARTAKTAKAAGGGGAEDEEHERTDTDGGAWAARVKEFGDENLYKIAAVLSQQPNFFVDRRHHRRRRHRTGQGARLHQALGAHPRIKAARYVLASPLHVLSFFLCCPFSIYLSQSAFYCSQCALSVLRSWSR